MILQKTLARWLVIKGFVKESNLKLLKERIDKTKTTPIVKV